MAFVQALVDSTNRRFPKTKIEKPDFCNGDPNAWCKFLMSNGKVGLIVVPAANARKAVEACVKSFEVMWRDSDSESKVSSGASPTHFRVVISIPNDGEYKLLNQFVSRQLNISLDPSRAEGVMLAPEVLTDYQGDFYY